MQSQYRQQRAACSTCPLDRNGSLDHEVVSGEKTYENLAWHQDSLKLGTVESSGYYFFRKPGLSKASYVARPSERAK